MSRYFVEGASSQDYRVIGPWGEAQIGGEFDPDTFRVWGWDHFSYDGASGQAYDLAGRIVFRVEAMHEKDEIREDLRRLDEFLRRGGDRDDALRVILPLLHRWAQYWAWQYRVDEGDVISILHEQIGARLDSYLEPFLRDRFANHECPLNAAHSYLKKTARNAAFLAVRIIVRWREGATDDVSYDDRTIAHDARLFEEVEFNAVWEAILRAVEARGDESLELSLRLAYLHHVEGWTYDALGAVLEISGEAVRRRVERASRYLADELGGTSIT